MTVAKKTICHKLHTLSQGSVNDCYVDAKNALRENTHFFIVLLQVTVESISCDWGISTRGTVLVVARIILWAWFVELS